MQGNGKDLCSGDTLSLVADHINPLDNWLRIFVEATGMAGPFLGAQLWPNENNTILFRTYLVDFMRLLFLLPLIYPIWPSRHIALWDYCHVVQTKGTIWNETQEHDSTKTKYLPSASRLLGAMRSMLMSRPGLASHEWFNCCLYYVLTVLMSFEPKKMGHQLQLVITLPSESENEKKPSLLLYYRGQRAVQCTLADLITLGGTISQDWKRNGRQRLVWLVSSHIAHNQ